MAYVDGFLVPVPAANREAYVRAAKETAGFFLDYGALRVVEAWGEDVPHGNVTDFYRAVKATGDEAVVFAWTEWPSREVRDAAGAKMAESGPFDMPFDGKRMIYGGFGVLLAERAGAAAPRAYVDGFVIPVPEARREAYHAMAATAAPIFLEHGALEVVETWGDDLPRGHTTDFHGAVQAEPGETVVFSWIIWPSKAARDAGNAKVMADERMKMEGDMVFNPQRMFWGGFEVILDEGGK